MKTLLKKLLTAVIIISAISFANAQTSVSGGIYANTIWTLAGSPYIVTDTIVVFPGFTLTIEPGVVVKFDSHVQLELRQASLIANGTSTDSITFTSNGALSPGSWYSVVLNGGSMNSSFNYCNFRYANTGLTQGGSATGSLTVKHCDFSLNTVGLNGSGTSSGIIDSCNFHHNASGTANISYSTVSHCNFLFNSLVGLHCWYGTSVVRNCLMNNNQTGVGGRGYKATFCTINNNQAGISGKGCSVDYCTINHNQTGMVSSSAIEDGVMVKHSIIDSNSVTGLQISNRLDSIIYNEIKYNGTGITDDNMDNSWTNLITKNVIENNGIGLQVTHVYDNIFCNKICNNTSYDLKYTGSTPFSIPNNYFCTADSASAQAVVYDGYDNISYGLVNYMPLDNSCYLTIPGVTLGVSNPEIPSALISIYPNPATDNLTVVLPTFLNKTEIKIFNMLGELQYSSAATKQTNEIDISQLANGIYIIQVSSLNTTERKKFVRQ